MDRVAPLVLVVDDYVDNREMYREYLEFAGYRVITAENGAEAIERVRADRPDLVFMDLSLPIIDGWEATRRLKADPETRHVPIVAVTGNDPQTAEKSAREAGCDAFLTKPCLPHNLERAAEVVLAARAEERHPLSSSGIRTALSVARRVG